MRKIVPVIAAGATTLALATGTFAYATVTKDVTLAVDGRATEVRTTGSTVADVLADQGIAVGQRDVVAPGPDAPVAEGTRIAVQFARQLRLTVDGQEKTLWTTATTVDGALAALRVPATGARLSADRSTPLGREGLDLAISTRKSVALVVGGKRRTLTTTAENVGEVLAAAKVPVDGNDRLSAGRGTPVATGSTVTVTKVDVKTATDTRTVDFDTVEKRTDSLEQGDTEVRTAGRSGARVLTFRRVLHDGKEVSRTKTGSKLTRQPVDRVVLVGTKEPEPEPENRTESSDPSSDGRSSTSRSTDSSSGSSSDSRSGSRSDSGSSDSGSSDSGSSDSGRDNSGPARGVWDRLAQCESGGDWSINTGNGFYGGLQFTPSTWRGYGGSGMPHRASRAEQIRVAERVLDGQGWGAWPACSAKLGLR